MRKKIFSTKRIPECSLELHELRNIITQCKANNTYSEPINADLHENVSCASSDTIIGRVFGYYRPTLNILI